MEKQTGDRRTAQALEFHEAITKLVPAQQLPALLEAVRVAAELDPNAPPTVLIKGTESMRKAQQQPLVLNEPAPQSSQPSAQTTDSGHNWPPIITLSEAEGYFFASGSAEVPYKLQAVLKDEIVGKLLTLIAEYNVDVIEVIGHTDEQPVIPRQSNLDHTLLPSIRGISREAPIAADNAGLGLARAAAVVRILREDRRLAGTELLPLSGGQLISVGDRLSTTATGIDAPNRRRIEIRLRRRSREAPPTKALAAWETRTTSASILAETDALSGHPKVLDADTFALGETRIRLWGIDAIEGTQTCYLRGQPWDCGREATRRLEDFIADAEVTCAPMDRDRHGRIVAKCSVRGVDVGDWLVSEGWALDYEQYSSGAYRPQQLAAQSARRGVWQSTFNPPWEFRRHQQSD
jgi:endonuclease YncB( thermonuclease family)/outer membrane protein OmpA-like peptidoglycan-associated protein